MEREPLNFYRKAIQWSHAADKVVNLVLSYALALSSLIAYLDVLGNGGIIDRFPPLFYVWLGVQGLGVELQILIVLSRLPELLQVQGTWKRACILGFNIVFILLLAYISIIIGAIFTQHGDTHGSIQQAMRALGVNAIAFVYQRAAMATFLLILMGIDRMMERWRITQHEQYLADLSAHTRVEVASINYEQLAHALNPHITKLIHAAVQDQASRVETQVTDETASPPLPLPQQAEPAEEQAGTDQGQKRNSEQFSESSRGTVEERLATTYRLMQDEHKKVTDDIFSRRAGVRKETALHWLKSLEESQKNKRLMDVRAPPLARNQWKVSSSMSAVRADSQRIDVSFAL